MRTFTQEWLDERLARQAAEQPRVIAAAPKPHKYRAQQQVDPETGKKVASKRELTRLQQLRLRFRAGEIDLLATQVWFRLEGARYEADAVFGRLVLIDGVPHLRLIVDDAKGVRTPTYRQKKRQMKERYGIDVQEV